VALVSAVSYAMASLAKNLPLAAEQTVVLLGGQFPSHVYPWRRIAQESGAKIVTVEPPSPLGTPGRAEAWNERLLDAITPEAGLVALPIVHWADGTKIDVEAAGARAREVGAAFIIDGTQSIGAMPFDVQTVRPDAVACAGYKWLLGPYGMGAMWLGERFRDGVPLEETWIGRKDSDQFGGLTAYTDEYASGAARFDTGERSNGTLPTMLAAGLTQVLAWTPEAIQATCEPLATRIVTGARDLGYGAEDGLWRGHHLFGLAPPDGVTPEAVKAALAARGIAVSIRGTAVRVSPHVYNTMDDADALVAALADAA